MSSINFFINLMWSKFWSSSGSRIILSFLSNWQLNSGNLTILLNLHRKSLGERLWKRFKKIHLFFLLQINVIWSHFIFIIDHIKIMSFTCFSAVLGCYFVLLLSSTPTSRKRGLFVMLCSKLWPVLYWIIDPSDKCHRSLFISLALGSAKRWCNFSVMEQCDKFTPENLPSLEEKRRTEEPEDF